MPPRLGSVAHHLARLDVHVIAPRPQGLHRLESALDHVTVEFNSVAVRVGEVDAPSHVVRDGRVDLDSELTQLAVGRLQLREAPELPGHVVKAGLARRGRLTGGELEEGQVVMLLADAQEHRTPLLLVVGDLQPQHPGIELLGFLHVPHLQDHVAELACLDHPPPPRALAALRLSRRCRPFAAGPQYRRSEAEEVGDVAPPLKLRPRGAILASSRLLAYRPFALSRERTGRLGHSSWWEPTRA